MYNYTPLPSMAALARGTALANFCEDDYVVSPYIWEFWNTVSSLVISAVGVLGLLTARRTQLPASLKVLYTVLIGIGLGSAYFHGSQSHAGQLCDELPMMVFVLVLFYNLVSVHPTLRHSKILLMALPWVLASYGVATIGFMVVAAESAAFFRVAFGVIAASCILLEVRLWRLHAESIPRWLLATSISLFLVAFGLWIADHQLCPQLRAMGPLNPQLHAHWHMLSGVSCHWVIAWLSYVHFKVARVDKLGARRVDSSILPVTIGYAPIARHVMPLVVPGVDVSDILRVD